MDKKISVAIFCKIIDNYGDIGICWRLAKQLEYEHKVIVTLWVNNLHTFRLFCPTLSLSSNIQKINKITIRHWLTKDNKFNINDIADIVIEFFGCGIPFTYIDVMAKRFPRSVWLNLEGLTAEKWVESYHMLSSPYLSLPLIKYFFFPGFTRHTGGLLQESHLKYQRLAFQNNAAYITVFFKKIGITFQTYSTSFKISLFCYSSAPVTALFIACQNTQKNIICFVPIGIAMNAIKNFFGYTPKVGMSRQRGSLTVYILPFLSQIYYDKLLWVCDLNFVRGEDSFVRAQWACRPLIWQIYPQEKNLHHIKLNAFLDIYNIKTNNLIVLTRFWNNIYNIAQNDLEKKWSEFIIDVPNLIGKCIDWEIQIRKNGDLTSNILKFVKIIQSRFEIISVN